MEHNSGNQNMPPATQCRTGCGFYGNSQFEGMCSKCFKDAFKRRQQNSSPTQMNGRNSPLTITSGVSATQTSISPAAAAALTNAVASVTATPSLSPASTPVDTSKAPNIDTATPTVPSSSTTSHDKENASNDEKDTAEVACAGAAASTASETDENSGDKEKKPKKNRCHTCKKKVGLTGFECRCGGMYCSMHRYSDKHGCTFNYKELAQAQIRKNNPVVVGKKIQKI